MPPWQMSGSYLEACRPQARIAMAYALFVDARGTDAQRSAMADIFTGRTLPRPATVPAVSS